MRAGRPTRGGRCHAPRRARREYDRARPSAAIARSRPGCLAHARSPMPTGPRRSARAASSAAARGSSRTSRLTFCWICARASNSSGDGTSSCTGTACSRRSRRIRPRAAIRAHVARDTTEPRAQRSSRLRRFRERGLVRVLHDVAGGRVADERARQTGQPLAVCEQLFSRRCGIRHPHPCCRRWPKCCPVSCNFREPGCPRASRGHVGCSRIERRRCHEADGHRVSRVRCDVARGRAFAGRTQATANHQQPQRSDRGRGKRVPSLHAVRAPCR